MYTQNTDHRITFNSLKSMNDRDVDKKNHMTTDTMLREIFEMNRTIAVYGMSGDKRKPAHQVPAFLMSRGYRVIPVNPFSARILGQKSYSKLKDIPEEIDILEVFQPSDEVIQIVKDAISRRKERGDIGVIWLQEGIRSEESRRLAEAAGVVFVEDRCMYKEYKRLIEG